MNPPNEEFIRQLTDWQNRLFGYLVTVLGSVHDAREVLQETNLVLWRKMDDFEPGTNFGAWAKKCAHFQALAFLRECLADLSDEQRRLLRDRYRDELPIVELAKRIGKKTSATKMTLM